ncbi:tetratricopeptide repeat protein [Microvirga rosea]|uniref:tetratricopeptide repeat protein n=1 Tax=Microvirga rosea TaxID=2715425 RepID=UPI001D09C128|nr:tetratricopeptide repeat protein [Microvirga rosea]MCB8823139.1 sel1 repeat family protein [Microvirga rosea]
MADPLADGQAAVLRGDYTTALQLLQPVAEQGDIKAQNELGLMYVQGLGVVKNETTALEWFRKAADRGYAAAQYNLGLMYLQGRSMPKDAPQAYFWFRFAILHATDSQIREIAEPYLAQAAVAMTPAQIAEAQRKAAAWTPALARIEESSISREIGLCISRNS